ARRARVVLVVLGERAQGRAGLHAAHSGAAVALDRRRARGRRGIGVTRTRWLGAAAVALLAAAPLVLPEFHVTLLNYIGLYAIVALGLVLVTGVAGLTSVG